MSVLESMVPFDMDRCGLPEHYRESFPIAGDLLMLMLGMPLVERMRQASGYHLRCIVMPEEADRMLVDERWWPWLAAVPEAVHGRIHAASRTRLAAHLIVTVPPPGVADENEGEEEQ